MPKRSVRYKEQLELKADLGQALPLRDGIAKVREMAGVKAERSYQGSRKRKEFDQTVELVVHLGIDAKQADQLLRGSLSLPKGIGRTKRVIAFCESEEAEKAKAAGAIEAGVEELVEKISGGWTDFDVAIAHPAVMGKVGKLGRVLGPSGKMPSPKSGTVTKDVEVAVREFAAGKVEVIKCIPNPNDLHLIVQHNDQISDDIHDAGALNIRKKSFDSHECSVSTIWERAILVVKDTGIRKAQFLQLVDGGG